jgi:hypothetical protein
MPSILIKSSSVVFLFDLLLIVLKNINIKNRGGGVKTKDIPVFWVLKINIEEKHMVSAPG